MCVLVTFQRYATPIYYASYAEYICEIYVKKPRHFSVARLVTLPTDPRHRRLRVTKTRNGAGRGRD